MAGIAGFLERIIGGKASDVGSTQLALGATGQTGYNYGQSLTTEGLASLRSLDTTYQGRLNDPLGAVGRGIFTRALGGINDTALRTGRAFGARVSQLATQSGGTLSPEAQAELQLQNSKSTEEQRFTAQNDLTNTEAAMTLSETGKLFDRMENIRKTIVGVGQDEKTRGLQAIIASLTSRLDRNKGIASTIAATTGGIKSG